MREYRSRSKKDMMRFFPCSGSKRKLARCYPNPKHTIIVEPFAGSAGYSTVYFDRLVLLYDIDPVICGVWDYLIHVDNKEFMSLPLDLLTPLIGLPIEARNYLGLWASQGRLGTGAKNTVGRWAKSNVCSWGVQTRYKLGQQLDSIRHWSIEQLSFESVENHEATWFVDPPYHVSGRNYRYSSIDYGQLSEWVQSRLGQVIVCQQYGATWLPFTPLRQFRGGIEVILQRPELKRVRFITPDPLS